MQVCSPWAGGCLNSYVAALTVLLPWLMAAVLAPPALFGAAVLQTVKGRRGAGLRVGLASVLSLGCWGSYLAMWGWPEAVVLWVALAVTCALASNALAASVLRDGAVLRYGLGVVVGLGPPLGERLLSPPGAPDLPVLVWSVVGGLWTLLAGVVWAWVAALRLPVEVEWD